MLNPMHAPHYLKESAEYSFWSLFRLPPDPLPLCVFLGAILMTGRTLSKWVQGKGYSPANVLLLVGSWGGHHGLMETRMQKELKATVETLATRLNAADQLLDKWGNVIDRDDTLLEKLQGEIRGLKGALSTLGSSVPMLTEALKTHEKLLDQEALLVDDIEKTTASTAQAVEQGGQALEQLSSRFFSGNDRDKMTEEQLLRILKKMEEVERRLDQKIATYQQLSIKEGTGELPSQ